MIQLSIVTLLLLALAAVILSGKGDFLVAGYNTAPDEEKKKVNVKRMRKIVAGLLFFVAAVQWLPLLFGKLDDDEFHYLIMIADLVAVGASIVFINAKDRNR